MTKQLLKLFGFPFHTAPGEAEAECALLQLEGLVDAVLSEDVDTLMFGCGLSLRNWTSEGTRGNKTPTHVNLYEAEATKKGKSGLDRSGMILVALMSGGDYIPAGVPGCGIKIACQAAKAGFGEDLCKMSRKDKAGFQQWREKLANELKTNESHFFRSKHKALTIPDNFPDSAVLGYYTHPVVSSPDEVSQLFLSIAWDTPIDIPGLRLFAAEAFEWQNLSGAKKFVRGLAPALLIYRLRLRGESDLSDNDDLGIKTKEEEKIIASICGHRTHFVTDGTPELRVDYNPADIVGLDLENENPDDYQFNPDSDTENLPSDIESGSTARSPVKRPAYDPTKSEKIWILETYAKLGVPLMVETWEDSMRVPKKRVTAKARQQALRGGMNRGALDSFFKVSKPGIMRTKVAEAVDLPPVFLAPSMDAVPSSPVERSPTVEATSKTKSHNITSTPTKTLGNSGPRQKPSPVTSPSSTSPDTRINPWTFSKRPPDTFDYRLSPGTRYSALGIHGSPEPDEQSECLSWDATAFNFASTPPSPTPCTVKKHSRPSTASLSENENNSKMEPASSLKPPPSRDLSGNAIDLCTPSPRKKRTSTKATGSGIHIKGVKTPNTLKVLRPETTSNDAAGAEPLTRYKPNRKLTFSPESTPPRHSPPNTIM